MSPPRVARWLLERALPADMREHVVGDLAEVFAQRRVTRGALAAWLWYWGQALSFSARFVWERTSIAFRAFSWIDLKLGLRMLVKYPGLTAVGGVALTVAFGVGTGWFEFSRDCTNPDLPLPEGERIVGIVNQDLETATPEYRAFHDFLEWRAQLRTITDLGAARLMERNLITDDGASEAMRGAEISASAFTMARVPPVLGRPLVSTDEAPGAPLVVVIGYDVWQDRFRGDRSVIGRGVRIGDARATVVGVMPEGFAFPVNHNFWTPMRLDPFAFERREGPPIRVFGRLAPGVSLAQAQTELTAVAERIAAAHPETNARLRPAVAPWVRSIVSVGGNEVRVGNLIFGLGLIIVCANVATLIFARTVSRTGEIVVRTALGATRARIVGQLLAEAVVLASACAALGMLVVAWGWKRGSDLFWTVQGGLQFRPFWWNDDLSRETVLYVFGATVAAAVVIGVLPALKVTGRGLAGRLRQATSGGASFRFGGVWTGVIVTQVAITVAFLPVALGEMFDAVQVGARPARFDPDRLLIARVWMDEAAGEAIGDTTFNARLGALQDELRRRLAAEPGVEGVLFGSGLPGFSGAFRAISVDGAEGTVGSPVRTIAVDREFFSALEMPVTTGRSFDSGDLGTGGSVAIVDESFVRQLFGRESPIGRRVQPRLSSQPTGPEVTIVGVVPDLGGDVGGSDGRLGILYRLAAPGEVHPLELGVLVAGDPEAFAPRLQQITASLSPSLRLTRVQSLNAFGEDERRSYRMVLAALALVSSIALLLSTVGIHALMSFAVSQRTREIGIRTALGAGPRRIVASIFSRAVGQLSVGVVLGAVIALAFRDDASIERVVGIVALVAALMMAVGLLACAAPARRALRIQPTEALRGEG